jgi:uncharacterized protein DUF5677
VAVVTAVNDQLAEFDGLLEEAETFAQTFVQNVRTEGNAQELTVALFASAWELYRGIRVLLRERLGEEARMLWRTLLDDMALLMWLANRPEERERRALRYYYTSTKHAEFIARAATAAGFAWAEKMEAGRAQELDRLRAEAEELGFVLKEIPNTQQLLENVRQHPRLYYHHVRASQTIHSTPIGLSSRFRPPEQEGEAIGVSFQSDIDEITQVGIIAAQTFIGAMDATSQIMGWDAGAVAGFGAHFSPRAETFYSDVTGKNEP